MFPNRLRLFPFSHPKYPLPQMNSISSAVFNNISAIENSLRTIPTSYTMHKLKAISITLLIFIFTFNFVAVSSFIFLFAILASNFVCARCEWRETVIHWAIEYAHMRIPNYLAIFRFHVQCSTSLFTKWLFQIFLL